MNAVLRAALQGAAVLHEEGVWKSFQRLRRRFGRFDPPVSDRRFWVVQGLVFLIAIVHTTFEAMHEFAGYSFYIGHAPSVPLMSFLPVSLFFVPVVYAALNFGFSGAVATAAWCTVLTVPNVVMHDGFERVRELTQLGIVDAIAVFVGHRVEREKAARSEAEETGAALRRSETRYRGLFEASPVALLVANQSGFVRDANPAAGALLERSPGDLRGAAIDDLLGAGAWRRLIDPTQSANGSPSPLVVRCKDGAERHVQPAVTGFHAEDGEAEIQVLLRDITDEVHHDEGMRAFTARILQAQEEERKRIAQELHDDTIQTLIPICRRLDAVTDSRGPLDERARAQLREARQSAEKVVAGLRDFARMLRPPTLDDLGLVTSIERLLMDLAERSGLSDRMVVEGEQQRLSSECELNLFRIAQESLRNVEKHAEARSVVVTMSFGPESVVLEVADDGKGFTAPAVAADFAASRQLGLLGMRERAEHLGGKLEVESAPGVGTRVRATMPLACAGNARRGA